MIDSLAARGVPEPEGLALDEAAALLFVPLEMPHCSLPESTVLEGNQKDRPQRKT